MEGNFIHNLALKDFNKDVFTEMLNESITQVREGNYSNAMELLLLKSIESMKKYALPVSEEKLKPIHLKLKPIHLHVDNESHPLYTLIDIVSEDSFLFLMDRRKEKILSTTDILELKSSILMIKYFSTFMTYAPNPSLAYKTFNRIIEKLKFEKELVKKPNSDKKKTPAFRGYHELFRDLARVLGTGEVIMGDFLRLQHVDLRELLGNKEEIKNALTPEYLTEKLNLLSSSDRDPVEAINRFKDQYLFHLDLRLLTGEIPSFEEFCGEMSCLTDLVMTQVVDIALKRSLDKFSLVEEPGIRAILALGKWGSQEMGYCSDVELVFVYDGPRNSDGKVLTEGEEFYVYLGNQIPGIVRSKTNGVFELDLRLRPEGDSGLRFVGKVSNLLQ